MKPADQGFTLLEMIISMLIVSAIVLLIYSSYSTVVRTWERNQAQIADVRFEAIGDRLVVNDWRQMTAFDFVNTKGSFHFLFGSPTRFAYATKHGLGGRRSIDGRLFFALLMIEPLGEGVGVYSYKTDVPESELADLVVSYLASEGAASLEARFFQDAILLKEADEAEFSYDSRNDTETENDADTEPESGLRFTEWRKQALPARVRLTLWRNETFVILEGGPGQESRSFNASTGGNQT